MNPNYTYLLINIGCFLIPFIASFYPKYAFYKEWNSFFKANIIVAFLFLVWDYYFTIIGVWGFNNKYLLGIYLLNLPIEEIMFFIAIPYACTFTFFALKSLVKQNPLRDIHLKISYFLIIVLSVIAIFTFWKWYTSLCFLLMIGFLIFLIYKKENLSLYYLSYIAIFPFFLLSNGILTGFGITNEVVWYNNNENIGIRIGTIPIEDVLYGMLLLFMNIYFYNIFKKRKERRATSVS